MALEFGKYLTSYEVSELIYHLSIGTIGICNVPGKSEQNPNKVYYKKLEDPFHDFSETNDFTDKEIEDFNHLRENINSYHTLLYEKNGKIEQRKLG